MGTQWASDGHRRRKRKSAARTGPLTWCLLERMTRFELATLTLAKNVTVTVRTVRLLLRSAPQSAKPSVQSVSSVQFVYRPTIARALCARQLALRTTAWPRRTILAMDRFSISRVPTTTASS